MMHSLSENIRVIATIVGGYLLNFIAPTFPFLLVLISMFTFNIICGMRADGVIINRSCQNFNAKKFRNALWELITYLGILLLIYGLFYVSGGGNLAIKGLNLLTFAISYYYCQKGLKNLIIAYPNRRGYWLMYHLVRFEFHRMSPSSLQPLIDRFEKKEEKNEIQSEGERESSEPKQGN